MWSLQFQMIASFQNSHNFLLGIILLCIKCCYPQCSIMDNHKPEEVYSWSKTVDFFWPNNTFEIEMKRLNRNRLGVPIGIKVFQDRIYLTLPRWSGNTNIPVNLAWVSRPNTVCRNKITATTPKLR